MAVRQNRNIRTHVLASDETGAERPKELRDVISKYKLPIEAVVIGQQATS